MINKHLTLDDRYKIERGLNEQLSFKKISAELSKDCTTISKEVKNHLVFERKGAPYRHFNDCANRFSCKHYGDACMECNLKKNKCSNCAKCTVSCIDYKKEICTLLSKPPYVCNGCPSLNICTLEKRFYKPLMAQNEYETLRSESRSGFNIDENELKHLDSIISPLLKNGQSLHHIISNNKTTISCCEKTAYLYADNGLFTARNIDMPRKVRFRPRSKKSIPLKVDKACRVGRTYEDFEKYCAENPSLPIVEIDSVEGIKGGAVLLTIHFTIAKLQLAFIREANDSQSVTDIFNNIYDFLGDELFRKLFPIILADNGTEFSNPEAIEKNSVGEIRTHLFYCDSSSPNQKGACENNHEFIRRVIPKGTDLSPYSQEQISLMMDNINSYSRPELGDKSPYEMFEFYYGKETLDLLGVKKIPSNDIILKSSLLNNK